MAANSPWDVAEQLTGPQSASHEPALAVVNESPHLVWNDGGVLFHAHRGPASWSLPIAIAMGTQPALVATTDGDLHCLFSNSFAGNYEIYHSVWHASQWSLPANVSHTGGASTRPVLASASDGTLHAAWMDDTPGYSVIYHGQLDRPGAIWTSIPIPNSRGQNPALGIVLNGDLTVAWQDHVGGGGPDDILCAQCHAGAWGLPANISDSPDPQSILPSLAEDVQGFGHLVWQEQRDNIFQVAYCQRVPGGWTPPAILSAPDTDSRLPHLVTGPRGFTELIWLEGNALRHCSRMPVDQGYWSQPETFASGLPAIADLAVAMSLTGHVHVVWSAPFAATAPLFYSDASRFSHTQFTFLRFSNVYDPDSSWEPLIGAVLARDRRRLAAFTASHRLVVFLDHNFGGLVIA